jgi:2-succinyl-5-enolpyruvyl-6-hydroxy-3-cyclohexene-1-carboxylate synthase
LTPELVFRIGDPPVSKVVNQWLTRSGAEQIAVTPQPTLIDPDKVVKTHIVSSVNELLVEMSRGVARRAVTSWIDHWVKAESVSRQALDAMLAQQLQLTEPLVATTVIDALPNGAHLVLSSSMPVRDVEWFGAPRTGVRILSNRGVNGIDGVVSTAVGVALASGAPTTLLIGDIALLHDSNGLLNLIDRLVDLKIVLIDNEGGGIFSFLPQAQELSGNQFEQLFGTPHHVDFASLAAAHRIPYSSATTANELRESLAASGTRIIAVRTDRKQNVADHNELYQAVSNALNG